MYPWGSKEITRILKLRCSLCFVFQRCPSGNIKSTLWWILSMPIAVGSGYCPCLPAACPTAEFSPCRRTPMSSCPGSAVFVQPPDDGVFGFASRLHAGLRLRILLAGSGRGPAPIQLRSSLRVGGHLRFSCPGSAVFVQPPDDCVGRVLWRGSDGVIGLRILCYMCNLCYMYV